MNNPIILVVGTRAEAIKLLPVYLKLKQENFPVLLCATFQHSDLLQQVLNVFQVKPDFNLNIMIENQDLFYITSAVLEKTKHIYQKHKPSLVIVHGDTTTTMAAAMSAFYLHIPIAHVEAGLRTGNMQAPFPEEMNRKVVGQIANLHFAPTALSTANLLSEGVPREHVFCTGNTIVDALNFIKNKIDTGTVSVSNKIKETVTKLKKKNQKIVLLTAHRRESFDGGLTRVFESIKTFASKHNDITFLFPVHPNPNVKKAIDQAGINSHSNNIIFLPPIVYTDLLYILINSDFVITDSGGIQEEAVTLGKMVLVLRDITERLEGVWEGTEILVGTNKEKILSALENVYKNPLKHIPSNVYGDGHACERIATILKKVTWG